MIALTSVFTDLLPSMPLTDDILLVSVFGGIINGLSISLCLLGMGCLACRPAGEALYGVQNLSGPSAALSILSGEAARYDAEMTLREEALNDPAQPVVTLSPLTAVPDVFMDDLIVPGAEYDVRPSLAAYYGKEAILIAGEEENADE